MKNNQSKRQMKLPNENNANYREFHHHRTKTHRLHSLDSESEKKKFAKEYAKITT